MGVACSPVVVWTWVWPRSLPIIGRLSAERERPGCEPVTQIVIPNTRFARNCGFGDNAPPLNNVQVLLCGSESRSACRLPVRRATGGTDPSCGAREEIPPALHTACTDVSAGTWKRRRVTQRDSMSPARWKSSAGVAWPTPETRCLRMIKHGPHQLEHDKNAINRHSPGGESLGLSAHPASFPPQSSLCPGCRLLPPVDCSQWRDAGRPRPSDRSRNG